MGLSLSNLYLTWEGSYTSSKVPVLVVKTLKKKKSVIPKLVLAVSFARSTSFYIFSKSWKDSIDPCSVENTKNKFNTFTSHLL